VVNRKHGDDNCYQSPLVNAESGIGKLFREHWATCRTSRSSILAL
jgi:hypothetical protein